MTNLFDSYSYGNTYSFGDTPTRVSQTSRFMFLLCKQEELAKVLTYIENNPYEVNACVKGGVTPLMLLSQYSSCAYYHSVLDKILPMVEIDLKDSKGNTALMYATMALGKTSSIEAVNKLVSHGADWNQQCEENMTPLMYLGANTPANILVTLLNSDTMVIDKRDNKNNSFATIVTNRLVSTEPNEDLKNIVKNMLLSTNVDLYRPVSDTKRSIMMTLATNDTYFDLLTNVIENDVTNNFVQHVKDVDVNGNNIMTLSALHFKDASNIVRLYEMVTKKYDKLDFDSLPNNRGETFKFLVESHANKQLKEMIYPQVTARVTFLAGCYVCLNHRYEYITFTACTHGICSDCYVKFSSANEGKTLQCPQCRTDVKDVVKHVAGEDLKQIITKIREENSEDEYDEHEESSESEPSDTSDEEEELAAA